MDKTTLQKESITFRTTASRLMHCNCDTFDDCLARVLHLVDTSSLPESIFDKDTVESYDTEAALGIAMGQQLVFAIDIKEEASQIYALLKALSASNKNIRGYTLNMYRHSKYQENLDQFQEEIIQPFIGYVNNAYYSLIQEENMHDKMQSQTNVIYGSVYGNVENHQSADSVNVQIYSRDEIMAKLSELEGKLCGIEDDDAREVGEEAIASLKASINPERPAKAKIKAAIASLGTIADIATLGTTIAQLSSMLNTMLAC